MSERLDTLTTRMVDVIDALPVPAGPGRLRPRTHQLVGPRLEPVTVLVVVVLALAALAATPVGRDAVSEAGRLIERLLGLGPWPAYYGTLTTDPDGIERERLLFWDGTSPGRSVLVAPKSGWRGGWWSPDRSAIVVAAGSSIYIGDRSGVVREIADLDPLLVMGVHWIGSDRIFALARGLEDADWLFEIDVSSGQISRRELPEDARPARKAGLLGRLSYNEVPPARKFSQDGRWLITGDLPCRSVAVYDLASDRRIELADGVGTNGTALGWLRGSILLWAACDLATGTLHVRAGPPDAAQTEIGSIPIDAINASTGPVIDEANDRILIPGRAGDEWIISTIELDGQQAEIARVRITFSSPLGGLQPIGISRDGRLLAVNAIDWANTGYGGTLRPVARAGVIDLRTGEIAWACDKDCAKIRLR